jgi:hypothetical protein
MVRDLPVTVRLNSRSVFTFLDQLMGFPALVSRRKNSAGKLGL